MEPQRHTALAVAIAVSIVSLLAAGAAAGAGYVVWHRDHNRIHTLEAQVRILCARRTVTSVIQPSYDKVIAQTAKGC